MPQNKSLSMNHQTLFHTQTQQPAKSILACGRRLLLATLVFGATLSSDASILFDFSDAFAFSTTTPFSSTVSGVTANFSVPPLGDGFTVNPNSFSLPVLSGNVLEPDSVNAGVLKIDFNGTPLSSISLNFATMDFTQVEAATTIRLTAYSSQNSQGSIIGSPVTAQGDYNLSVPPVGTLSFTSPGPSFYSVTIDIPTGILQASQGPAGAFSIDNLSVSTAVPEPASALATGVLLLAGIPLIRRWRR
jgi:hypothetical protein